VEMSRGCSEKFCLRIDCRLDSVSKQLIDPTRVTPECHWASARDNSEFRLPDTLGLIESSKQTRPDQAGDPQKLTMNKRKPAEKKIWLRTQEQVWDRGKLTSFINQIY
jgi:hypothetical protein